MLVFLPVHWGLRAWGDPCITLHPLCTHITGSPGALHSQHLPSAPSHQQDPDFPLPFPHCLPPSCQLPSPGPHNLSPFLPKFNLAETWDGLSPQHVPSPREGVAISWIHTHRGLYGCSTTQELGGPMLTSPAPTQAQGHAKPFFPSPTGSLQELCLPGGKWVSTRTVGKETLARGQVTTTQLGKSDVSPYMVSLCTGVHAEGLVMNSGKCLF